MDNKARLTGTVFHKERQSLGYVPEEQQMFFVLQDDNYETSLGLIDLLKGLWLAEEHGCIPPLNERWWKSVDERYELGYFQDKTGTL
ncbi:MAG: hypothetical protein IJH57_04865 [Mogibacterium sp.]|nr:hypothetical protein [Mogibacterium sp.]